MNAGNWIGNKPPRRYPATATSPGLAPQTVVRAERWQSRGDRWQNISVDGDPYGFQPTEETDHLGGTGIPKAENRRGT